jgi:hypothetical protein
MKNKTNKTLSLCDILLLEIQEKTFYADLDEKDAQKK